MGIAIKTLARYAAVAALAAGVSPTAAAGPFTFTKIADTATAIPGGTGSFIAFGTPSIAAGDVAFVGAGPAQQGDFQRGIYADIGGLDVVVDNNTAIPGGAGNFNAFVGISLDEGNVAFAGAGLSSDQAGIYTNIGGLNVVADRNTAIPGGTGSFVSFIGPSLDKGSVAFIGGDLSLTQTSVYTDIGGGLNVVADRNTTIPGGTGNFVSFSAVSLDGGNVAFLGGGASQAGVYTNVGGLNVVADRSTAIPGGTGNFQDFRTPLLDGANVAFVGATTGQQGIYTDVGGLNVVADRNTAIPDGTGNFQGFGAISFDDGNLAFVAVGGSGQAGIYTDLDGVLAEVITLGDILDGKDVADLTFGEEGLSGESLAFRAVFADGSVGIFRADLVTATAMPEPGSLLVLALGLGGVLAVRHGRREQRVRRDRSGTACSQGTSQ